MSAPKGKPVFRTGKGVWRVDSWDNVETRHIARNNDVKGNKEIANFRANNATPPEGYIHVGELTDRSNPEIVLFVHYFAKEGHATFHQDDAGDGEEVFNEV